MTENWIQMKLERLDKLFMSHFIQIWVGWGDVSSFIGMSSKTKHPTISWSLLYFFSICSKNTSAATLAV